MQVRRIAETSTAFQWYKAGDFPGDAPLVNSEGRIVKNYQREGLVDTDKCSVCSQPLHKHGWIDPLKPPADPATAHLPVDPVTGKKVIPPVTALPSPDAFPKTYEKLGNPTRVAHNPLEEKAALELGYVLTDAPPTIYPRTYTKSGLSDRVVNNESEEKDALAADFVLVASRPPAPLPGPDPVFTSLYPKKYVKQGALNKTVKNKAEEDAAIAAGFAQDVTPAPLPGLSGKPVAPVRTEGIVVHPGWYVIQHPVLMGGDFEVCDDKVFRQLWEKVA